MSIKLKLIDVTNLASDNRFVQAMKYYASFLDSDDGIPVNKEEAFKYFK